MWQRLWAHIQASCSSTDRSDRRPAQAGSYTSIEAETGITTHRNRPLIFVFAADTAEDLVSSIGALQSRDVDDLLEVMCAAINGIEVEEVRAQRVRFGAMLASVSDPAGEQAYALTCVVAACDCVLQDHSAQACD